MLPLVRSPVQSREDQTCDLRPRNGNEEAFTWFPLVPGDGIQRGEGGGGAGGGNILRPCTVNMHTLTDGPLGGW